MKDIERDFIDIQDEQVKKCQAMDSVDKNGNKEPMIFMQIDIPIGYAVTAAGYSKMRNASEVFDTDK